MRIVLVWVVGLVLISIVMVAWYITQPLLIKVVEGTETVMVDIGENSTRHTQTNTLLKYFINLWAVPFVLAIGLWMFISSQRQDWESRAYG